MFSRDLILKEVSELNGIVRIILRSVCNQFHHANGLSIFQFDAVLFIDFQQKILIDGFNGIEWITTRIRDSSFVFKF